MDVRPKRALVALFRWAHTDARFTRDILIDCSGNWPFRGPLCGGRRKGTEGGGWSEVFERSVAWTRKDTAPYATIRWDDGITTQKGESGMSEDGQIQAVDTARPI